MNNSKEQSRKESVSSEAMHAQTATNGSNPHANHPTHPTANHPSISTENFAENGQLGADHDGAVDAVFTRFKSVVSMAATAAPGSLSIDTSAQSPTKSSALHRHKVCVTPSSTTSKVGGSNHQIHYSKPPSPTKATSPTLSIASSTNSSVESSGVKLMVSNIILRKRESIAFFIDLLSPDSLNLRQTQYRAGSDEDDPTSPRSDASPRSPLKKVIILNDSD